MDHYLTLPLTADAVRALSAGDSVYLTGQLYTARDAAHKRLRELLQRNEELPFPIRGSTIYYVGPTPAKPGSAVGAAGPTTSYRMDGYAPQLLDLGLRGMIGKGERSQEVVEAIQRNHAVYFGAIGGAGALLAKQILAAEIVAFADLGSEAIRVLTVENFPSIVIIDSKGNNLYQIGRKAYLEHRSAQE